MSDYFHQLASRFAGESFFAFLCTRQFRFAGHARRRSMRLRSTLSQARRFPVRVCFSGAALAYVPAFAARRGFRRFLRATNLPERVGELPSVLRSTRVLGRRFSARLQTRRERQWFVAGFAAARGDLSRSLRADEGLLEDAASSSTSAPGDAFGTEEFPCGRPCSPITLRGRTKNEKRLTMALQLTAPRVTVAAVLACAFLLRAFHFRSSYVFPSLHPRSYRAALRLSLSLGSLGRFESCTGT